MSKQGVKYIVYTDGRVEDEFENEYKFESGFVFVDEEGNKHRLNEKDILGIYDYCEKTSERVPIQNFSISFDVNVSFDLVRGVYHDAHVVPFKNRENPDKEIPDNFKEFVKSKFGREAIILPGGMECSDEGYKVIHNFEVKLKNKESNLEPVIESESESSPLGKNENLREQEDLFLSLVSQYENNLKRELRAILSHLYHEVFAARKGGEVRKMLISNLVSVKERNMRERMPTQKGRVPIKQQNDFEVEKERFLNECFENLEELEKRKLKLNKTQLAEILVEGLKTTNPLQSLRRKFQTFDLSFEEVLRRYTEQKSS